MRNGLTQSRIAKIQIWRRWSITRAWSAKFEVCRVWRCLIENFITATADWHIEHFISHFERRKRFILRNSSRSDEEAALQLIFAVQRNNSRKRPAVHQKVPICKIIRCFIRFKSISSQNLHHCTQTLWNQRRRCNSDQRTTNTMDGQNWWHPIRQRQH